jgi:hypothetical protein
MDLPSSMYRENDPELEIFNRKNLSFFLSKIFSRACQPFGEKKVKKNSFRKVVGSPWIHPICKNLVTQ